MSRCKNEATETAWLSVCCASAICLKRSQTTQMITEPSVAVETEGIHKQLLLLCTSRGRAGCAVLLLSQGCMSASESVREVWRFGHSQRLLAGLHFYTAVSADWVCLVNLENQRQREETAVVMMKLKRAGQTSDLPWSLE